MTQLPAALLQSLRTDLSGGLIAPGDAGYDAARRGWNGRFDRRPGAIARCAAAGDVVTAIRAAREHGIRVAVRSGGHSYAGNSSIDDGLLIDLSAMGGVDVDAGERAASVGPGVRWGAFDAATQAHGLATTGGTVSTVGVPGYTLGGGTGYLARKHGLALDNLTGADVVTADARIVRVSATENPDLFWALRGGSGNFGVVTTLDFRLHELGPEALAGQIVHPFEDAGRVLRFFRDFMADAPDSLQVYAFLIRVPPVEPFPEEHRCRAGALPGLSLRGRDRRRRGRDEAAADLRYPHPGSPRRRSRYVDVQLRRSTPARRRSCAGNLKAHHLFTRAFRSTPLTLPRGIRYFPARRSWFLFQREGGAIPPR